MHKQVPLHVALIRYLVYFAAVVVSRRVSALPPESRDPFPSPQSILHIGSQCNRFTRARESFVQTSYIVVTLIAFSLRFRGDKSTWSRSPFAYNGYRETNDFSGDKNLRCSVCLSREVSWRGSLVSLIRRICCERRFHRHSISIKVEIIMNRKSGIYGRTDGWVVFHVRVVEV